MQQKKSIYLLVILFFIVACNERPTPTLEKVDPAAQAKAEWEAKQAEANSKERMRCTNDKATILDEFEKAMKSRSFTKAQLLIYRCSTLIDDVDYSKNLAVVQKILDTNEIKSLINKLKSTESTSSDVVSAFEKLREMESSSVFHIAQPHMKKFSERYKDAKSDEMRYRGYSLEPKIGWSQQELITRKGYPTRTNRTVTGAGTTEQYIYCYGESLCSYFYLNNGIVVSYQD